MHALMERFVATCFDDFIIGFMFIGKDRARILRHEVEHATRGLGGGGAYTGRPLRTAHAPLQINQGHFRRRLALLRSILLDEGVDADLVERWIARDAKLIGLITNGRDCVE